MALKYDVIGKINFGSEVNDILKLNGIKDIEGFKNPSEDNIEDFIILDDEWEDLKLLTNKLILTSDATPNRPILGYWYCRDGLRFIHVIKAIKMLGIKKYKEEE